MSRPRTPYGPRLPGRLPGTMIKVLAAELSDQGRLSRGKRYWADGAVLDIVVGHGAVTAEIQGSRPQPYVVTLEAAAGTGVPSKRDLWVQCTCPDDTGTGVDACKHAVAALFALSDEVTIEPELVDRWRDSRRPARAHTIVPLADTEPATEPEPGTEPEQGPEPGPTGTTDDAHHTAGARVIELHPRAERQIDKISVLLQAPAGAAPPTFPPVTPVDHRGLRDRRLHEVLDDALDHLAIRWE